MKRLVLLTLILVPSAFHVIGNMSSTCRPTVTMRPRGGEAYAADVARDQVEAVGTTATATRVIRHLPSATPDRARNDAWEALRADVAAWMSPLGVPESWSPPEDLLHALVREEPLEAIEKDYATIYIQPLVLDVSNASRQRILETYERELAGQRLLGLAGALAFVLSCLAAVAGYIRADEATRGYYTTTLRVTALAAVGAAGAAVYYAMTHLA